MFAKEKEHLSHLINDRILDTYKEALTRKVTNESAIYYQSAKYSVPTAYVGKTVEISVEDNKLYIYYNKNLVTLHDISEKIYNFKEEHIIQIAVSDAFKNANDKELKKLLKKVLKSMINTEERNNYGKR